MIFVKHTPEIGGAVPAPVAIQTNLGFIEISIKKERKKNVL